MAMDDLGYEIVTRTFNRNWILALINDIQDLVIRTIVCVELARACKYDIATRS